MRATTWLMDSSSKGSDSGCLRAGVSSQNAFESRWRPCEALISASLNDVGLFSSPLKSDTPRGAGGLMGWAASKAVVH